MTVDILISKMTLVLPNMLVLYHGFMQPIFMQDLQLISPIPLAILDVNVPQDPAA
jgi:DNA phosphorothioation-dependent restriction protein DptG